jgi:hypothetical protein
LAFTNPKALAPALIRSVHSPSSTRHVSRANDARGLSALSVRGIRGN